MLVFFLSFLFFLDMTVSNAFFFFLKSSVFLLKEKKNTIYDGFIIFLFIFLFSLFHFH